MDADALRDCGRVISPLPRLARNVRFLLTILIAVFSCAKARADSAFLRHFDSVVFGLEEAGGNREPVVVRWAKRTIAVNWSAFEEDENGRLQPAVTPRHLMVLGEDHLKRIGEVTGLEFVSALEVRRAPGLTVVFAPGPVMAKVPLPGVSDSLKKRLARGATCYFVLRAGANGQLRRAFVVVNPNRSLSLANHCLLEEISQSLGAPNDSNHLRPSIFSDLDAIGELTVDDRRLLEILYHPEMHPGLGRNEALELAGGLLRRLRSTGQN